MSHHIRVVIQEDEPGKHPTVHHGASPSRFIFSLVALLALLVTFAIGAVLYNVFKTKDAVIIARTPHPAVVPIEGGGEGQPSPTPINLFSTKDRFNILLLGLDRREDELASTSRTDTVMVASVNPKDKTVLLISIPRDLRVEFPIDSGNYLKINEVHSHYTVSDERGDGPRALKRVVSSILGIPVHYFVRIDFSGFERVVDELGGVTIEVPETLRADYPTDNYGWTTIKIPAGTQVMDGDTALKYARARHVYNAELAGDINRALRQQQVMIAIKEKALANSSEIVTNPFKLRDFLSILSDSLLTDIQLNEMIDLARLAQQFDTSDPTTVTSVSLMEDVHIYSGYGRDNKWYYFPIDPTWYEIHSWVEELLKNPTLQEYLADEEALIEVQNGTSSMGLATEVTKTLKRLYQLNTLAPANANEDAITTSIIDYSGGKHPHTIKFLENYFDVEAISPDKILPEQQADIEIILGEDYAELLAELEEDTPTAN